MNTPMHPNEPREQQLERLIDKALRDQPLRRAPAGFEDKVMAAIAQRAAAPWWRDSFAGWPVAVRLLFLIASVGFAKAGLDATALIIDPLDPATRGASLFASVAWIPSLLSTIGAVLRDLPSLWIYGGLSVLGALYLTLFGVSAAAYRTLYVPR
ncbi:MAG TPA: hypothetical protein VGD45_03995 [Steroidobacter sp.]|uniref:hypothetical protein n=1 Tax=Steroidobacter sp. TaxID=1978227 RepID=UPI002EDA67C1